MKILISLFVIGLLQVIQCQQPDGGGNIQPQGLPIQINPCSLVKCGQGTFCKVINGQAYCVPDKPPQLTCATVLCIEGHTCVMQGNKPVCVFINPGPIHPDDLDQVKQLEQKILAALEQSDKNRENERDELAKLFQLYEAAVNRENGGGPGVFPEPPPPPPPPPPQPIG